MSTGQLALFETDDSAARKAHLEARLSEAVSDCERDRIGQELAALEAPWKRAIWNGRIVVTDEDIAI